MSVGWPQKDPDAYLDYSIDWEPTLEVDPTDTISTSLWDSHPDLVVENDFINGFITGIWVGGGVDGKVYDFVNTIQTANNRTFVAKFRLTVKDQLCVVVDV